MDATISLTINGQQRTVLTDPQRPLLDVLREELQLTGSKYGCGEGQCGACTVLIDGQRTRSCGTPIFDVANKSIRTIEGLSTSEQLHFVQQAFLDANAFQCGYCTPGMIMSTVALLEQTPSPDEAQIREWMNDNLCRCCGYAKIIDAVKRAAGAEGRQP